jgi:segregation and condensation protein B
VHWLIPTAPSAGTFAGAFQILADGGIVRSTRLARLEAALLIPKVRSPAKKLSQVARLIDVREVQQLIQVLNDGYDRTRSAFRIEQTAAGYILMTRASLSAWLDRLHNRQAEMKLSAPMMETLTIVAYQQPVTRADVEAIRGVQSAEMIRQLMDRGLLRIGGEDDSLGRPFLYETTRDSFCRCLGCESWKICRITRLFADKEHYQRLLKQDEEEEE